MRKHYKIKILGSVQGIGFRYFAVEQAKKFNLNGFVCNLADSSVYLEVEGEKDNLKEFIKKCRQGPALAKVERLEVKEGELENFKVFKIEKGTDYFSAIK
jgi:acylphosphatase